MGFWGAKRLETSMSWFWGRGIFYGERGGGGGGGGGGVGGYHYVILLYWNFIVNITGHCKRFCITFPYITAVLSVLYLLSLAKPEVQFKVS